MDYQKLILRIKCPEIRECPFQEPMSCAQCRDTVGEDSIFAIKELLSRVEELEAKNRILEEARENANEACAKWEGLYRAELEKKSAWVSVKDRLPDNEKPVLAYYGFYREKGDLGARFIGTLTYFSHDQDPHWQHESTGLFVTHWMPLPEPPKEE